MKTITQMAPTTIMSPAAIQVEKFIESGPSACSQSSHGSRRSHDTVRPQVVNAIRSETPSARSTGTRLTIISETPIIAGVAASPVTPDRVSSPPKASPTAARASRRRRRGAGGSGRFRIAAEIVIVLTRQAETATTASVSRTPSA